MAKMFEGQARSGVLQITPYVPGARPAADDINILRLASNENPYGASAAAIAAYSDLSSQLHRYPDGAAINLREAIASKFDIDAAQVVCGAGSDELISLICRAYAGPGDDVLISEYGFMMYRIAAQACGATPVMVPEQNYTCDLEAMLDAVTPSTRVVFIANPNNPTGTMLPIEALTQFRTDLRDDILLVLDAAYCEYVREASYKAGDKLVQEFGNTVVMRTFSKIHGLAALRLGWAYCPPNVADMLNRVRGPFNVCAPAQAAGIAALNDDDHVEHSVTQNAAVMANFCARASAAGYSIIPSFGNFVLIDLKGLDQAEANAILMARSLGRYLEEHKVLVRPVAGYGLQHHLRITIGTADEMTRVADLMAAFARDHVRTTSAA